MLTPFSGPTDLFVQRMQAADVDGDGRMDAVLGDFNTGEIHWLRNDAAGVWPSHAVAFLSDSAEFLLQSDVDSDGDVDVIASGYVTGTGEYATHWYENDGTGMSWITHPVVMFPFAVTKGMDLADMDGDGVQDLILRVLDSLGYTNYMLYEGSAAGFSFVQYLGAQTAGSEPLLADLHGGGDVDFAGLNTDWAAWSWRRNDSTPGHFQFPSTGIQIPTTPVPRAADWDGDGDQDLFLIGAGSIRVCANDGSGSFGSPTPVFDQPPGSTVGTLSFTRSETRDMNGDGDKDLLFSWSSNVGDLPTVAYIENQATGGPSNRVDIVEATIPRYTYRWDVCDFEGDGDFDIVQLQQPTGLASELVLQRNGQAFGQQSLCAGVANSTGQVGQLEVTGSETVALNVTTLTASALPQGEFTLFLIADMDSMGFVPPGSQGVFCLGGGFGRFNRPGELRLSDSGGRAQFRLDLGQMPSPMGSSVVLAGQSHVFQAWHRDRVGGSSTSNFTSARIVQFL